MFGFFEKGKIEIKLEKLNFSFGDTIKGTVLMQLKKPIKAKGVSISLVGEQKTTGINSSGMSFGTSVSFGSSSSKNTTKIERIFDFKMPLDVEKEYGTQPYEYAFEIKVPMIGQSSPPQGFVGDFAKAMSFLSTKRSVVTWYLETGLDIPMGFDVSKKIQINIG
jgi:hypothetical protein